jgi:hypothetical protein
MYISTPALSLGYQIQMPSAYLILQLGSLTSISNDLTKENYWFFLLICFFLSFPYVSNMVYPFIWLLKSQTSCSWSFSFSPQLRSIIKSYFIYFTLFLKSIHFFLHTNFHTLVQVPLYLDLIYLYHHTPMYIYWLEPRKHVFLDLLFKSVSCYPLVLFSRSSICSYHFYIGFK